MKQKKLLQLGGIRYLLSVIEATRKLGCNVITCDYLPNNIAYQYLDEYINVSIIDKKAILKIAGISFLDNMPGVEHNYSYFPVFIDANKYGMKRDELYEKMKTAGVYGRRYFYPLISEFSTYRGLDSARPENLKVAHQVADSVICLPMHSELSNEDVEKVIQQII